MKFASEPGEACVGMTAERYLRLYWGEVPDIVESGGNHLYQKKMRPCVKLTDCANTRCKNTCMTMGGFGKTACTIWASWATVVRISENKAPKPGSLLGGLKSGSGRSSHLRSYQLPAIRPERNISTTAHSQLRSILERDSEKWRSRAG